MTRINRVFALVLVIIFACTAGLAACAPANEAVLASTPEPTATAKYASHWNSRIPGAPEPTRFSAASIALTRPSVNRSRVACDAAVSSSGATEPN